MDIKTTEWQVEWHKRNRVPIFDSCKCKAFLQKDSMVITVNK